MRPAKLRQLARTAGAFLIVSGLAAGQDAHGFGPVVPVDLPDIAATRQDGQRVRLRSVFTGKRSAVQFVFVDCTTACPLLGSLFGKVDRAMGTAEGQLVSITVNPERDTAARMAEWMAKFNASERWVGLRVDAADLPRVLRAFKQASGPPSGHALQVFLVDDQARYVARTIDLPSAAAVAEELRIGFVPAVSGPPERLRAVGGREIFEGRGGVASAVGPDALAAAASACSGCHGAAGQGGGEGKTVVPPLTLESLTALRSRRGGPPSRYSPQQFCESLRTGMDPAGVQFSEMMPRYQLDGRTCRQLWDFLAAGPGRQ